MKKGYVLITGASTGIGYDSTRLLIENGFKVFATVRNEAHKMKLSLNFGSNVIPLILDITDSKSIETAKSIVENQLGDEVLVALVNNAGISLDNDPKDKTAEEFMQVIKVNLLGTLIVLGLIYLALKTKFLMKIIPR